MRIDEVKVDKVYKFTKSGVDVRVVGMGERLADGMQTILVARVTSGKQMLVNANQLEDAEYEQE